MRLLEYIEKWEGVYTDGIPDEVPNRIEHLKRFTTNSMGTDQGKISSINALGIVSKILKKDISEVGTTTYRPPYSPVNFSAIA